MEAICSSETSCYSDITTRITTFHSHLRDNLKYVKLGDKLYSDDEVALVLNLIKHNEMKTHGGSTYSWPQQLGRDECSASLPGRLCRNIAFGIYWAGGRMYPELMWKTSGRCRESKPGCSTCSQSLCRLSPLGSWMINVICMLSLSGGMVWVVWRHSIHVTW
jgi:hypothetical protein